MYGNKKNFDCIHQHGEGEQMKKVLILDDGSVGVENYAIRNVLESFGYLVTIYPIGRPQHYFDVFGKKRNSTINPTGYFFILLFIFLFL